MDRRETESGDTMGMVMELLGSHARIRPIDSRRSMTVRRQRSDVCVSEQASKGNSTLILTVETTRITPLRNETQLLSDM